MYEKCLFFNLNSFTRQINRFWEEEFGKLGISASHGYFLRLVLALPGSTQKELAEKMDLAASTVTRFIDALTEKGYLKRTTCCDDARSMTIAPTRKAEGLEKDIDKALRKLTEQLVEKMGQKNVADLVKILRSHQTRIETETTPKGQKGSTT